jgi:penicillin-binding protein 1A
MGDADYPGGRSSGERLFWQDGRWRPGVLIDWARWNPEADAEARAADGRPAASQGDVAAAQLFGSFGSPDAAEGGAPRAQRKPFSWRWPFRRELAAASVVAPAPAAPAFADGLPPGEAPPRSKWHRRWPWIRRGLWAFATLLALIIAWLAFTAPLSRSLQPIVPPQMTILSAQGTPIARNGDVVDRPVEVAALPPHVVQAFLATEDRTFYDHIGISARGFTRALWTNITTGRTQGGSTITQQLAKFTFLNADQTITRKAREALIAIWMEVWLTKDEILGRYLSNAHFGGNVYGLRAASLHYFYRQPERLTLTQAAMLAGMLRAPNRYNPLRNLDGAQERERVVLRAMVDAGYLTEDQRRAVRLATTDHRARESLPSGTYFADWALPQAREGVDPGYEPVEVTTTLDDRMQRFARQATSGAALGRAQVALVAMRTNGEVVAMVGGRSYAASPFNRATQARRQPGSTFKLVVYYAALQAGMTPDTPVDDNPITTGTYRPVNAGGRYRGQITLREAFAQSSNVVAVRLYQELGSAAIQSAARDLGITAELPDNASVALGSASMTLLELTSAYAAVAANQAPVEPHAIRRPEQSWFERMFDGRGPIGSNAQAQLLDMLRTAIEDGTGRAARLGVPAFGKTGTSQDNRDALFIGFAGDLVVGVWVGNDDNSPLRGVSGGGLPARIWRDFMVQAVPGAAPQRRPPPQPEAPRPDEGIFDDLPIPDTPAVRIDPNTGISVDGNIGGVDVRIGPGGVNVQPGEDLQNRIDEIRRRAEELETQAVERR